MTVLHSHAGSEARAGPPRGEGVRPPGSPNPRAPPRSNEHRIDASTRRNRPVLYMEPKHTSVRNRNTFLNLRLRTCHVRSMSVHVHPAAPIQRLSRAAQVCLLPKSLLDPTSYSYSRSPPGLPLRRRVMRVDDRLFNCVGIQVRYSIALYTCAHNPGDRYRAAACTPSSFLGLDQSAACVRACSCTR